MSSEPREDRIDAAIAAYLIACETGTPPSRTEFLAKYPDVADALTEFLADHDRMRQAIEPQDPGTTGVHLPDVTGTFDGPDRSSIPASPVTVRYFGDYELLSEIARGGMGVVFKARQVSLNRTVALKMILRGEFATARDVERFRTEAESAANLDHPNVLPIHEVGEHEGHQYFSMKLVEGGNLSEQLSRFPRPTVPVLVALLIKIARAVHFAHQRGILHRDLKPSNILIDREGTPYVADFGLARKVEGDSSLTQTGAVVGTPSYVAPEQARGVRHLTTGVDVYSLGAILYEILTGRPPFRAASVYETLRQVAEVEPDHPRAVDPAADGDLSVIALKCLAKDSAKRYESAAALADDLDRWLRGEPILARPASRMERAAKWVRRNPVVAALGLAVATALIVGTMVSTYFALEARREARDAIAQRKKAEDEERRAIDRLVQVYLTNGAQRLDADDALGSLPFFTEALRLDERDPDRASVHRARLTDLFRRSPKLVGFWTPGPIVTTAAFLPDGRMITGHQDGVTRVWALGSDVPRLTLSHGSLPCAVVVSPDGRWAVTVPDRILVAAFPKFGL